MGDIEVQVEKELTKWPGLSIGGTEFRVKCKAMGHIHDDYIADLGFPVQIRDRLVEEGKTSPHHVIPKSGWVSYWITSESDN